MNSRRRVAVIGAGISGLGAAWLLSRKHDVVLFEAASRLGGHAWTFMAHTKGQQVPVDIGFIVFNHVNYPHLCRLFDHLDIATKKSDMSFAVSVNGGEIEYSGRNLRTLFAQPTNAAKLGIWRMFLDIAKFNKVAISDVAKNPEMTLGEWIERRGFGTWFQQYYLLPMSGAIWSTPRAEMLKFPAVLLVKFFDHHGLLTFSGQHQWWTVEGGSRNYVSKLVSGVQAQLRTRTPVERVARIASGGVTVKAVGDEGENFDEVVFACHTDQVLELLGGPTHDEQSVLKAIPYRRNKVVLHTDSSFMPKRKACWSSWVYLAESHANEEQATVTYWMNSLQNISIKTPLFVTLNPSRPIAEERILAEHPFDHPQYNFAALEAHSKLPSIQGHSNIWYCGAWTGMGFHEDGLASAVRVAQSLGVSPPWLH